MNDELLVSIQNLRIEDTVCGEVYTSRGKDLGHHAHITAVEGSLMYTWMNRCIHFGNLILRESIRDYRCVLRTWTVCGGGYILQNFLSLCSTEFLLVIYRTGFKIGGEAFWWKTFLPASSAVLYLLAGKFPEETACSSQVVQSNILSRR